ncbi:Profilin-3 [Caenorhabditis elegans]|uniref:Profilin-3 n=1 Tax=Caenorhabditis elegans TaxID=6239 RepID=PROF3_CAEEL|nr:Profilin-3 [Caenorhabditis elegans]Q21193.1 RecName: Full=Profilin-3 [Caenorhabditis elegans]AAT01435.1 profilin-3 [Caenorhabditis elegans]CCD62864.1 Profilin-3 [Caenorhabditis elegans]|eukprot:NP_508205.1 Profilin-3 [Caenorhabditis elegans]
MSWSDIINNNLIGSGNVSKAAILGFDGAVWAKSDNFNISVEEAVAAGKAFTSLDALLGTGLRLEGQKFLVLNADNDRIIGKQGGSGFFIYKTIQAVIISIYEKGLQPEMCSKTTGALADYFRSIKY